MFYHRDDDWLINPMDRENARINEMNEMSVRASNTRTEISRYRTAAMGKDRKNESTVANRPTDTQC